MSKSTLEISKYLAKCNSIDWKKLQLRCSVEYWRNIDEILAKLVELLYIDWLVMAIFRSKITLIL